MASVLIAGGNEDLARQLVHAGHTVWQGGSERAAAADTGARFLQLDVTSDESLTAAASALDSLDVLVNNAAELTEPDEATAEVVRERFEADLTGLVRVLQTFLPLLERSTSPVVLNVTSRSAPLAAAAVNVVAVEYAKAYPQLRIEAVQQEDVVRRVQDL